MEGEGEVSGIRGGEGKEKRTESRFTTVPGGAATSVVVLSTLMIALPAALMNVRPLEVTFAQSWYVTFPFTRKGRYVNEKKKTRTRLTPKWYYDYYRRSRNSPIYQRTLSQSIRGGGSRVHELGTWRVRGGV